MRTEEATARSYCKAMYSRCIHGFPDKPGEYEKQQGPIDSYVKQKGEAKAMPLAFIVLAAGFFTHPFKTFKNVIIPAFTIR